MFFDFNLLGSAPTRCGASPCFALAIHMCSFPLLCYPVQFRCASKQSVASLVTPIPSQGGSEQCRRPSARCSSNPFLFNQCCAIPILCLSVQFRNASVLIRPVPQPRFSMLRLFRSDPRFSVSILSYTVPFPGQSIPHQVASMTFRSYAKHLFYSLFRAISELIHAISHLS